jgi:hypothetical protein
MGRLRMKPHNINALCASARILPVSLPMATYQESLGDMESATRLTQVSPVAWQHINLCGRYEFTTGPDTINMRAIIQELADIQVVPEEVALTV